LDSGVEKIILVKNEIGSFAPPTRTYYPLHHQAVSESWPVREREILSNEAVGYVGEF